MVLKNQQSISSFHALLHQNSGMLVITNLVSLCGHSHLSQHAFPGLSSKQNILFVLLGLLQFRAYGIIGMVLSSEERPWMWEKSLNLCRSQEGMKTLDILCLNGLATL